MIYNPGSKVNWKTGALTNASSIAAVGDSFNGQDSTSFLSYVQSKLATGSVSVKLNANKVEQLRRKFEVDASKAHKEYRPAYFSNSQSGSEQAWTYHKINNFQTSYSGYYLFPNVGMHDKIKVLPYVERGVFDINVLGTWAKGYIKGAFLGLKTMYPKVFYDEMTWTELMNASVKSTPAWVPIAYNMVIAACAMSVTIEDGDPGSSKSWGPLKYKRTFSNELIKSSDSTTFYIGRGSWGRDKYIVYDGGSNFWGNQGYGINMGDSLSILGFSFWRKDYGVKPLPGSESPIQPGDPIFSALITSGLLGQVANQWLSWEPVKSKLGQKFLTVLEEYCNTKFTDNGKELLGVHNFGYYDYQSFYDQLVEDYGSAYLDQLMVSDLVNYEAQLFFSASDRFCDVEPGYDAENRFINNHAPFVCMNGPLAPSFYPLQAASVYSPSISTLIQLLTDSFLADCLSKDSILASPLLHLSDKVYQVIDSDMDDVETVDPLDSLSVSEKLWFSKKWSFWDIMTDIHNDGHGVKSPVEVWLNYYVYTYQTVDYFVLVDILKKKWYDLNPDDLGHLLAFSNWLGKLRHDAKYNNYFTVYSYISKLLPLVKQVILVHSSAWLTAVDNTVDIIATINNILSKITNSDYQTGNIQSYKDRMDSISGAQSSIVEGVNSLNDTIRRMTSFSVEEARRKFNVFTAKAWMSTKLLKELISEINIFSTDDVFTSLQLSIDSIRVNMTVHVNKMIEMLEIASISNSSMFSKFMHRLRTEVKKMTSIIGVKISLSSLIGEMMKMVGTAIGSIATSLIKGLIIVDNMYEILSTINLPITFTKTKFIQISDIVDGKLRPHDNICVAGVFPTHVGSLASNSNEVEFIHSNNIVNTELFGDVSLIMWKYKNWKIKDLQFFKKFWLEIVDDQSLNKYEKLYTLLNLNRKTMGYYPSIVEDLQMVGVYTLQSAAVIAASLAMNSSLAGIVAAGIAGATVLSANMAWHSVKKLQYAGSNQSSLILSEATVKDNTIVVTASSLGVVPMSGLSIQFIMIKNALAIAGGLALGILFGLAVGKISRIFTKKVNVKRKLTAMSDQGQVTDFAGVTHDVPGVRNEDGTINRFKLAKVKRQFEGMARSGVDQDYVLRWPQKAGNNILVSTGKLLSFAATTTVTAGVTLLKAIGNVLSPWDKEQLHDLNTSDLEDSISELSDNVQIINDSLNGLVSDNKSLRESMNNKLDGLDSLIKDKAGLEY